MTLTCTALCDSGSPSITANGGSTFLQLRNLFPDYTDYVAAGATVVFDIAGFTNPPDAAAHYVTVTTYDFQGYAIDTSSTLFFV